jgi:hypothetical protein
MQKSNIFTNILRYENNVSSLIVNLSRYELFKKELIDFLELGIDYKDINIDTEVPLQLKRDNKTCGRIDIMIFDKEDNQYLIENKITNYRALTKNQEDENYYIEYINKTKAAKKLLFLIPKNYEHLETIRSIKNNSKKKVEIKY